MTKSRKNRVVITGIGIMSPIGHNKEEVLENIEAKKSGIDIIKSFDVSKYDCKYGAELKNYDFKNYSSELVSRGNCCTQLALSAISEALADSRLDISKLDNRKDVGICVGSSHGALEVTYQYHRALYEKGHGENIDRNFLFKKLHSSILKIIAAKYRLNGCFSLVSTACASGNNALGMASDWIRLGKAKYVIAGGTDVLVMPLHAGFWGLKAVSPQPCAPFSGTTGITLGEGAAFFIMEDIASARERNATIYAEFLGYGLSGDAYHATSPDPRGKGVILALERAIADANVNRDEIDYVNAHGTGTGGNDEMESLAHLKFFGEKASQVPISSSKPYFGHTTGAAGAMETCVSILCMNRGILPPTLNFTTPRYKHGLDYIPNEVRKKKIDVFLANSFGFAGNNAVVTIGRYLPKRVTHAFIDDTKVAITGIGSVSATGVGVADFWQGLKENRCGIKKITRFDTSQYSGDFAALIEDFEPRRYDRRIDARRMDLISQFSCVAGKLCLEDAGIKLKRKDGRDVGIIMNVSSAPRSGIDRHLKKLILEGPDHPSSMYFPYTTQNSALGQVSLHLGLQGFTSNLHVDGCCSLNGLIYGCNALKLKKQQKILVGGGDEVYWTYYKMLSIWDELAPTETPSLPFSEKSKGYHPGEGAIFLMIEDMASARSRGARIYSKIVGSGMSIDSNRDIAFNDANGVGLLAAMETAVGSLEKDRIGMVCCTERGIKPIRQAELSALKTFFGSRMNRIAFVNTVPSTGWMDSVSPLFHIAAMQYAFQNRAVLPGFASVIRNGEFTRDFTSEKLAPEYTHSLCIGVAREGFCYALLLEPYNNEEAD